MPSLRVIGSPNKLLNSFSESMYYFCKDELMHASDTFLVHAFKDADVVSGISALDDEGWTMSVM
jgi:hypothetical protein